MVGHAFLEAARARGLHEAWEVVVFGAEPHHAYDRVGLSRYFRGTTAAELSLVSDGCYDGMTVKLAEEIASIDRVERTVTTASGASVAYDALVLATGSVPIVPPVPGSNATGCHVYRTIEDLEAIAACAAGAGAAVVIGGGLLGLEAADGLAALGLATRIVELADRLLPLQVDSSGGGLVRRHIEGLGLDVHTGKAVAGIETGGDGRVRGARLSDGSLIEAQVAVFAVGVRPRDELARRAGLGTGPRGGVAVDLTCGTSDPAIWAIGECACVDGTVYGLVGPGYAMADVVAERLAGGDTVFPGGDTSTKLKLMGAEVASFGDAFGRTPGSLEVAYSDQVKGIYKKLVVNEGGRRLLGGVLVGDTASFATLRSMARSGSELPAEPEALLLGAGPETATGAGLSDAATVCSCRNVAASAIRKAVRDDCLTELGQVKACTGAGTGCGSCVPLVKSLLEEQMALAGLEVRKGLCEHFDLTRQELFDFIGVQGLQSFDEVVARHGRGRGCEVCKPVVASILAAAPGHNPLDEATAALQDTNDHVLANMQRDGSYSVIPRVPGGEVTPEGLVAIGTIAAEFGLYTKITGAQRIDMLGARIEQLPGIWRRLVEAGFESGHAYGKAMRTVKSCVGSTWCRFGVQDSVAMAIALELRYRGLRSPHKLKSGVSGCARECAEARSKDVGVIATERGWNLYVAGNGGFSPRHADLLATDVDTETLIRYIDRFLMYYIRTAGRLQRTAAWVESLDGGLDHVHEVVIEDRLGLGPELEEAMARHVEHYADEWSATLADPAKVAMFTSFVNAPEVPDPAIVLVPERSQRRPASPEERRRVELRGMEQRVPVGAR